MSRAGTQAGQSGQGSLAAGGVSRHQHDARAHGGQSLRRNFTNSGGCSGNHHDLTLHRSLDAMRLKLSGLMRGLRGESKAYETEIDCRVALSAELALPVETASRCRSTMRRSGNGIACCDRRRSMAMVSLTSEMDLSGAGCEYSWLAVSNAKLSSCRLRRAAVMTFMRSRSVCA